MLSVAEDADNCVVVKVVMVAVLALNVPRNATGNDMELPVRVESVAEDADNWVVVRVDSVAEDAKSVVTVPDVADS